MATSPKEAQKLAEAQRIANEAIQEGSDLTQAFGRLLENNLKTSKHLHVEAKSLSNIIQRQLKDKKDQVSLEERLANSKSDQKDIESQIKDQIKLGNTAIAEKLKNQVKGLKGEQANLNQLIKIDKVTGGLVTKVKDFAKAITVGAIFAQAVSIAKKFGASLDKIGETFGSLDVMGGKFQKDLLASSVEATKLGGSIDDVASITNALASDFGVGVDEATQLSSKVFDTSKAIGLSADESANLFGTLMQTANLSAEQAESLAEGAYQLARQNGVAPSAVMKDIAGSAEEIAQFTMDGGDNIAEAAVQARKMGMSLSQTAKIASGLLDFENSIKAEQEASVLIGKQLNYQKARELALNNDIAGATKEIVSQLGSEEEFNKLNAIQRKSLADSIGVSVAEMSKMVGQSDKLSLSGAMAANNFRDLLGKEGIASISQLTHNISSLGATLVNTLGPALMTVTSFFIPLVEFAAGLVNTLNEMGVLLPIVAGALGFFAAKSLYAAGASIVEAYMKMTAKSQLLPPPLNIAAMVAGGAAIAAMVSQAKSTKVNDFKSGPGGITHMSGPAGAFQLNPRDSVLATTNPIRVNDMMSGPPGSIGGGGETKVDIQTKIVPLGMGEFGAAIRSRTYPRTAQSSFKRFDALVGRENIA